MFDRNKTYRLLVCVDCMMHHANGECGSCHSESGHDREPLSAIDPDDTVTAGMFREDHADGCEGENCDCEDYGFSWLACDGCGSSLDGDRYWMVGWIGDNVKTS